MISKEAQFYLDKINSSKDFHAIWITEFNYIKVFFHGNELFPMIDNYPALLSRQDGHDLRVSEIYITGLKFHSVEEEYKNNEESELYHKHFYFFTEAISNNRVQVLIKYFDVPKYSNADEVDQYLEEIKNKVKANPNYKLTYAPFGPEPMEMKLDIGGFKIRPKENGPFYFHTEFDADTYGDVMLKVDQIIRSLEN
jgi:hypothetical protein